MLTSKELIRRTGISRATLNNYIALGILPRPLVRRAEDLDERAPRIGYFPENAVDRIEEVQRLKHEGLSMARIAAQFRGEAAASETARAESQPAPEPVMTRPVTRATPSYHVGEQLRLSLDDIPGPAYMVNNNFEVVWWNDHALERILQPAGGLQGEIETRNIFRLLLRAEPLRTVRDWKEILAFHVAVARRRLPRRRFQELYASVRSRDAHLLEQLYDEVDALTPQPLAHRHLVFSAAPGGEGSYELYAAAFREGTLFAYVPSTMRSETILEFLSRREYAIRELLKRRMPFLTPVAVLVAELQDTDRLRIELPPEDYFALINGIWQASEPVFRKYYGAHGKHVGDGMVYYFFPQPDTNYVLNAMRCAHQLKEVMRQLSRDWQTRRNWLHEFRLDMGLNEGREWFGSYNSGSNVEFTVLGETTDHARLLSTFSRDGAVWATKHMIGSLKPEEQAKIRFGIRRRTERGEDVFVSNLYARVSSLVSVGEEANLSLRDVANLAVAEVVDVEQDDESGAPTPGFDLSDYSPGGGRAWSH